MNWTFIRRFALVGMLLSLVFGNSSAFAQSGTTSLRGTVSDKSGATISGAKVTLTNEAQGVQRDAVTSATGSYEFPALPPGKYSISIEMAGFRKFDHKNLELLVNVPGTENAVLEVGSTAEDGGSQRASGDAEHERRIAR